MRLRTRRDSARTSVAGCNAGLDHSDRFLRNQLDSGEWHGLVLHCGLLEEWSSHSIGPVSRLEHRQKARRRTDRGFWDRDQSSVRLGAWVAGAFGTVRGMLTEQRLSERPGVCRQASSRNVFRRRTASHALLGRQRLPLLPDLELRHQTTTRRPHRWTSGRSGAKCKCESLVGSRCPPIRLHLLCCLYNKLRT
jgi:hypothetical protein